ncbi:MAG: hypothetical protein LQ350_006654 [Teloschistes chrysophthalmus]|nr:MAG: hypothetical protein LQ350_006654 [Niorma chrysophthalma]
MSEIKKVVLVGAGGAVGPSIVQALSESPFEVTVFSHPDSKTTLPSNVKSVNVDFESVDALTNALKGQDAVVCTLGAFSPHVQMNVLNAAIAAGTKALPVYRDKVAAQDFLKGEADKGKITYNLIFNGPILDWGLMVGFLIGAKNKKAELYDGGDRPFSATTGASIGKSVVGALSHPADTKNRPVLVQDAVMTQNELIELAKSAGQNGDWDTKVVSTETLEQNAYVELGKLAKGEQADPSWPFGFIKRAFWGEGFGGKFAKVDNELLGVKGMSKNDIQGLIKQFI